MISSDAMELLLKISGDSSEGKKVLKDFGEEVTKLDKTTKDGGKSASDFGDKLGLSAKQASFLSSSLPIAGAAIAATAAAAAGAAAAIFRLSKEFAELGSEISKAQRLTGLSAESLSALKQVAQEIGVDFNSLQDKVRQFTRNLGQAANGSTENADKMKRLGVDLAEVTRRSDGLDVALRQVFKRLTELPEGFQRTNAAIDAFGEEGTKLLPIVKRFNGDIDQMITYARDLGVVMSEEDVRASTEFSAALNKVSAQVQGLGLTLGREFLPTVINVFNDVSKALKNNEKSFEGWAANVGNLIAGTYVKAKDLLTFLVENQLYAALLGGGGVLIAESVIDAGKDFNKKGFVGSLPSPMIGTDPDFFTGEAKKAEDEAKKRADEREKRLEKEFQVKNEQFNKLINLERSYYDKAEAENKRRFDITKDEKAFQDVSLQNIAKYNARLAELLQTQFALQSKKAQSAGEIENLSIDFSAAMANLESFVAKERAKILGEVADAQDKVVKANKESIEKTIKLTEEEISRQIELRRAANEKLKAMLEVDLAQKLISQKDFDKQIRLIEFEYDQFLLQKLEARRAIYDDDAEKRAEVEQQIALKKTELETKDFQTTKENIEKQIALNEELLQIKRAILQAEQSILDFRADQTRKRLENEVDYSIGKARLEALERLKAFEITEAQRRFSQNNLDLEAEKDAALQRIQGKENEEAQKFAIEELYRERALLAEAEFQARLKEIQKEFAVSTTGETEDGFLFGLNAGAIAQLEVNADTVSGIFRTLGSTVGVVVGGMADGIGQMINAWILYGDLGGQSLRKITAQVLANVAAQSAVLAVFELAKGFAALFFNPAEAAAHFKAAALYGSIAGVAAVAGRAVAGDAFKNESQGAFGSSNGQFASSGGSSSSSSSQTITREENRVQVQEVVHRVILVPDKGFVSNAIVEDFRNAGRVRDLVIEVAQN